MKKRGIHQGQHSVWERSRSECIPVNDAVTSSVLEGDTFALGNKVSSFSGILLVSTTRLRML